MVGARGRWAVVLVGGLCACSMLKKAGPAGAGDAGEAEAAVAVVEAAAPALAVNEAEITRYPDEKATPGATLTTEGNAEVRTEVGTTGKLVVMLKKGTEVSEVAERAGHLLVVAEDPKDASKKLMGWAPEEAFEGRAAHGHMAAAAGDGGVHGPTDAGGKHDAHEVPMMHDAGGVHAEVKTH